MLYTKDFFIPLKTNLAFFLEKFFLILDSPSNFHSPTIADSAINGLRKTLRSLQEKGEVFASQVLCSGLFQINERWAWCVLPHGVHKNFVKQNGKKLQHQEIKLKGECFRPKLI